MPNPLRRHTQVLGAMILGLGLLAACTAAPPPAPPAPLAETIPMPPVSAEPLRWRPGHWTWNGTGYTWLAGEFVPQAGTGSLWQQGHWAQQGAAWVWIPAGWVR